ncbi:hypothetical protein [Sulfurisphaera tokodaii]|uniref:PIN domain-containing protein n=2 Tax=Sulfurisphaera tokodaii TaxID=111955 RepID=Q96ZF1_SULTO|nr:hypothetical protein [Sulfurisphaera tokodaii]BAB66974.1 hypothetical protein STK_18820 [Sulfurisphaera tokodaii str. 7]HII75371.1 hypothetical protein [Sulfurisphaera tokodaii]
MADFVVITFSSLDYLKDLVEKYKDKKLVVTTLTLSKALKKGINPLVYDKIWIRAYSHKPVKIYGLDEADSESLLVAQELSAKLITSDENVEKIAKEMKINVVRYP